MLSLNGAYRVGGIAVIWDERQLGCRSSTTLLDNLVRKPIVPLMFMDQLCAYARCVYDTTIDLVLRLPASIVDIEQCALYSLEVQLITVSYEFTPLDIWIAHGPTSHPSP